MHLIYLILLLLFLCEPLAIATIYKHYVSEVLGAGARVKLEDGFIWEVPQDTFLGYVLNDYQGEAKQWIPGDEVVLDFLDLGESVPRLVFKLKNLRTTKSIRVKYRQQNPEWLCHYIVDIDPKGFYLTLSDGSRWEIAGFWNTRSTSYWSKGERVAVYNSQFPGDYILLNPDYGLRRELGFPTPYHLSSAYANYVDF